MPRELTAKGLATRGRIVEHASDLVCEHGVARVSMENIRDAAGVSNSQLFHYFPEGKSALMLAVARYAADNLLADQEPHLSRLTTWRAWNEWADALYARFSAQGHNSDPNSLLGLLDQDNEEMREILAAVFDRWEGALAAGIRSMQAAGKIRADLDAVTAATVLLAGIQGGVLMTAATGSPDRLRTTLRASIAALKR